ncbi:MAG: hybrid sensor histidine kinase/response regulator, partial [Deltaproteobacteria bacterium]|nr:hybrid sensor histidine kinase/response regulator [Deltaproteobacteria bacterium]
MDDITEEQKKDQQLLQIQKMETVGSLAGGLAHDFNNILGGITATLSIIKHRINKNGEISIEKLLDYINTIDNASNRAIEMVGQLLSLSRKKEVEHKLVDLNIILNNITKLVENSFDNSIKLISFPYKGSALVNADMAQIEQVLLNLCVNANHAMTIMRKEEEKKGGELTLLIEWIKVDNSFFQIHTDIDNNNSEFWCLSIQDTGIGMDKKTISKIFDPFYTTKKEGEGTGLGLSMVYNIMVQHNGAITVYSELDIGTRFCLFFPVISSDTEKRKNE